MNEKEWNAMGEYDRLAIHIGMTCMVGIIALKKLARKRKSVLVQEDKEWFLSFFPRYVSETKGRLRLWRRNKPYEIDVARNKNYMVNDEDYLKVWDIIRKYAEHLPEFIIQDICQIQRYFRDLAKELEG